MKADIKRILFLSLFLAVLGLVCAGMLAVVNHITEPIIQDNKRKELEKQLEVINIKDPTEVECELIKGVDAVYSGIYNKGEKDETECYVFQVTVKNDYTSITTIIAIGKEKGKIVALAPLSGDPSYTTHGKNDSFVMNNFGLIGSGSNNINSSFEAVAGATKSSESIKNAAKLAYEQFFTLSSNPDDGGDDGGDQTTRTYVYDGTYVAYDFVTGKDSPEIVIVEVVIKKDKVHDIIIDTVQGTDGKFNEQSKRELGYDYKMHYYTYAGSVGYENATMEGYIKWLKENNKLEWFEQMDVLADYILKNGVDSVVVNENNKFENVAGVTVSNYDYITLVKEAIQNAKEGKLIALTPTGADLVIATGEITSKGKLKEASLDMLQGKVDSESGKFVWNESTKNELGYEYKMHYYTYAAVVGYENATMEGYTQWLKENNKLEWFEQAQLIADAWLKDNSLSTNNGKFDTVAGVTISDALYLDTLNKLKAYTESNRVYKADGTYLAYDFVTGKGSPEMVFVKVVVRDDEVVDIIIDTIQGTDGKFNAQSKRELGYEYKMHYYTYAGSVGYENATMEGYTKWLKENNKLEWFEQMDVLADYILKNGVDSVVVNENNKFENVAGVTVSNYDYIDLVKEAIQNAKEGKLIALTPTGADLVIATGNVNSDGELEEVVLDMLQGKVDSTSNNFVWNESTKNELGYEYKMHYYTYAAVVGYENATMEGYTQWLKENNKLEWFEQAQLIADAWLKDNSLSTNNGKFDTVAGVTISDALYLDTLNKLKAYTESNRVYKADGTYLAYDFVTGKGSPEMVFVKVVVRDDEVVDIIIDTIQGTDGKFNAQSKRELGYDYKMHYYTYAGIVGYENATMEGYTRWLKENNKLEWFEQMDVLADYILKNGVDSVVVNENNKFENVAGVTVSNYDYIDLVKEAIQNAKEGKLIALTPTGADLVIATGYVNSDGELEEVVLDMLQGKVDSTSNNFVWNESTKNELGYEYKMHYYTYAAVVGYENATMEGYTQWLKENNKLEWFEQAQLIADAWLKDNSLSTNNGKFDTVAGVTISDALYLVTLNKLLEGKE